MKLSKVGKHYKSNHFKCLENKNLISIDIVRSLTLKTHTFLKFSRKKNDISVILALSLVGTHVQGHMY